MGMDGQIAFDKEQAPAFVNLHAVANFRNAAGDLDFDPKQVPWIDRPGADVRRHVRSVKSLPAEYDLAEKLEHWRENGFVVFEQLIDHDLIDTYLADLDEVVRNHRRHGVIVNCESRLRPIHELEPGDLAGDKHCRFCDFHNASTAGKKLALARGVVEFIRHVFRDEVVAMQTLTFRFGSEQGIHQDYAYVVSGNPSHLAASWIALEDVHPDGGPLAYYPGSHRIRKFDFGNGLFLTDGSTYAEKEFGRHIEAECHRLGLERRVFLPRKGDVFLWHAALAHEGTAVRNRRRTRLSLVTHYSSAAAYPRDRRNPEVEPVRYYHNGAFTYGDPLRPELENTLTAGGPIPPGRPRVPSLSTRFLRWLSGRKAS